MALCYALLSGLAQKWNQRHSAVTLRDQFYQLQSVHVCASVTKLSLRHQLQFSCQAWCNRYAMKTLEKTEMLERNKVGRVLTEEGILNQGQLPVLQPALHPDLQDSLHLCCVYWLSAVAASKAPTADSKPSLHAETYEPCQQVCWQCKVIGYPFPKLHPSKRELKLASFLLTRHSSHSGPTPVHSVFGLSPCSLPCKLGMQTWSAVPVLFYHSCTA